MRKNVRGAKFHAGSECGIPMWQTGCCRARDCFLEIKDRGASDEASRFLFLNEQMECFGGCSLLGDRVGDRSLSRVGGRMAPVLCCFPSSLLAWEGQCGAMADAARCDGSCSALRGPVQRAAFSVPLPGRSRRMHLRPLFCPSPKRNAARWSPPRSIPFLSPYACLQDAEVVCMARIRLYSWK